MMLKVVTVICALMACCYCVGDNELMVEETRAKKKKNAAKLWALVLLFIFSKVAVFKVASVVIFMTIFQKLFYLGGLFLNYYMRLRPERPPAPAAAAGAPVYGPPAEYNTVGHSYGPPAASGALTGASHDTEHVFAGYEYGLPAVAGSGGPFNNWLFNKS